MDVEEGSAATEMTGGEPAISETRAVLKVRDTGLDEGQILERVDDAVRGRLASGGYGPDVATLGPESLRPGPLAELDAERADAVLLYLHSALEELAERADLEEPGFHSEARLIGPLIVRVRRAWNWMAARWYVQGWMAQQVELNTRMLSLLSGLIQLQEGSERRIRELELELARLRADEEHVR